jgi:hypothetical protein
LSGCSSLEITISDNSETTASDSGLSIDSEVSFSPDNPDPETRIEVTIPDGTWVRFEVLNVTGHRVALLADLDSVPTGYLSIHWDATNDDGEDLKSCIYFYRTECEQGTLIRAVALCRTREECEDMIDGMQ